MTNENRRLFSRQRRYLGSEHAPDVISFSLFTLATPYGGSFFKFTNPKRFESEDIGGTPEEYPWKK